MELALMEPFSWAKAGLWCLKHWRWFALVALVSFAAWKGWDAKGKIDAREAAYAEALRTIAERDIQLATTRQMLKDAKASAEAAQAARDRNDAVIPKARKESDARVAAAATAGPDDSVRLGTEARSAYDATADRLVRGKSAR